MTLTSLTILFCACGQKPIDTSEFGVSSFPLDTGNRWEYSRTFYRIPFNIRGLADTISFSIIRHVIGVEADSTLFGAIIVDDSVSTLFDWDLDPYVERAWYTFDGDHLQMEAGQLLYLWGPGSITVYDPPRKILDFPLQEGKSWLLYNSDSGPVYWRVIDSDYYYLGDVPIFCNVVGTQSDFLQEYGVVLHEWYSEFGFVYGLINYGVRMYTDEIGQPIDSVYEYEETRLIQMNLVNE
jgi:hypothetical protein